METDERIVIGGIVRDNAGAPVAGAWVRLDETGEETHTTVSGEFIFSRAPRGAGYTLHAQAVGIGMTQRTVDVPSVTGEYDLSLP
jgi:hypothetical protein